MCTTPSYYQYIGKKRFFSYYFFTGAGVCFAAITTAVLAMIKKIPVNLLLLVAAVATACMVLVYLANYFFTAKRQFVFFRYQLFLFAGVLFAVYLYSPAMLTGIADIMAAGVAVFHTWARVGCYHAGCCRGRPSAKGVLYGRQHIDISIPRELSGVRIFPLQLIDGLSAALLFISGLVIMFVAPGEGNMFLWYVSGYAVARFFLEYFRCDTRRPVWKGVSEAQFTAAVTIWGCLYCAVSGIFAYYILHAVAAVTMLVCMLATIMFHLLNRKFITTDPGSKINFITEYRKLLDATGEQDNDITLSLDDHPVRLRYENTSRLNATVTITISPVKKGGRLKKKWIREIAFITRALKKNLSGETIYRRQDNYQIIYISYYHKTSAAYQW